MCFHKWEFKEEKLKDRKRTFNKCSKCGFEKTIELIDYHCECKYGESIITKKDDTIIISQKCEKCNKIITTSVAEECNHDFELPQDVVKGNRRLTFQICKKCNFIFKIINVDNREQKEIDDERKEKNRVFSWKVTARFWEHYSGWHSKTFTINGLKQVEYNDVLSEICYLPGYLSCNISNITIQSIEKLN